VGDCRKPGSIQAAPNEKKIRNGGRDSASERVKTPQTKWYQFEQHKSKALPQTLSTNLQSGNAVLVFFYRPFAAIRLAVSCNGAVSETVLRYAAMSDCP
jgi:hypothetical protein